MVGGVWRIFVETVIINTSDAVTDQTITKSLSTMNSDIEKWCVMLGGSQHCGNAQHLSCWKGYQCLFCHVEYRINLVLQSLQSLSLRVIFLSS